MYNVFSNVKKKLNNLDYIEEGKLTSKGEFSSKIYADEILLGEIFATDFWKGLNEFQILLLIACLCYEPREKTEFFKLFPSKFVTDLRIKLNNNDYLRNEKKFKEIETVTALIHLCYYGESIIEIIKNTNLLEGDIIRFFRQMLDRLNQVRDAISDAKLINLFDNCKHLIRDCLKEIDEEV